VSTDAETTAYLLLGGSILGLASDGDSGGLGGSLDNSGGGSSSLTDRQLNCLYSSRESLRFLGSNDLGLGVHGRDGRSLGMGRSIDSRVGGDGGTGHLGDGRGGRLGDGGGLDGGSLGSGSLGGGSGLGSDRVSLLDLFVSLHQSREVCS